MLVLTRKIGERINIGDDIVISVLEINRGSVRIGIDAPRQISILRHEVYEKIRQENLNSSQGISADVARAARLWRKKGFNLS
ncbi:MAG: carbon storage regulator CsrA [Desulfobacterales bacterium]|nr:carbon storage regulator CsrA [Desulfobacterales bacterium]